MNIYIPKKIYPYESYISIFYKVMRYSYLRGEDLLKDSGTTYSQHRMPFVVPNWLVSSASEESDSHIPTQFAPSQQILNPKASIRFCPLCMEVGFHSVFSCIKFYRYCSIHDVELVEMCPECLDRFNGNTPIDSYFYERKIRGATQKICSVCNLSWPDLGHRSNFNVDSAFMARTLEIGNLEAKWFRALMRGVFSGSYHCADYYSNDMAREALVVPIERLLGISSPDRLVGQIFNHQPVHWVTPDSPNNEQYDYLELDDYQPIRETLYTCCEALEEKYLRGHQDCLARINSLTEYGATTGVVCGFCSCALAYVLMRLRLACIRWPTITSVSGKKSGFDCFIQRAPCPYSSAAISKIITACYLSFLGEIQYWIEKGISFTIVLNAEFPWYRAGKHQSFFIRRSSYRFRNSCTQDLDYQQLFKVTRSSKTSGLCIIYDDNEVSVHNVLTF